MKIRHEGSAQSCDVQPSTTVGARKYCKRQARGVILACLGILFGSLTLRVGAATTIYLYDFNSEPIDVTASYSLQQHFLYDALNALVGTVDDSGYLYNLSGQQIGYTTASPVGANL